MDMLDGHLLLHPVESDEIAPATLVEEVKGAETIWEPGHRTPCEF
jgi:hypothetical protein